MNIKRQKGGFSKTMSRRLYVIDWWVWLLIVGLIVSLVKTQKVEREIQKIKPTPPVVVRAMYRISLLSSSVSAGYPDWRGPDQYIIVSVDGKEIIRTSVAKNTFYVDRWYGYSGEIILEKAIRKGKRLWASTIDVWLMDKDVITSDDVIAHWTVKDPTKLKKLSTDGTWVKFNVEKLKEKEQLKY